MRLVVAGKFFENFQPIKNRCVIDDVTDCLTTRKPPQNQLKTRSPQSLFKVPQNQNQDASHHANRQQDRQQELDGAERKKD